MPGEELLQKMTNPVIDGQSRYFVNLPKSAAKICDKLMEGCWNRLTQRWVFVDELIVRSSCSLCCYGGSLDDSEEEQDFVCQAQFHLAVFPVLHHDVS